MVLNRRSSLLGPLGLLGLLGGCGQSLFDAHGGRDAGGRDDGGPHDGMDAPDVPVTCGDTCIADAAADFDGTATGAGHRWRYLEDLRNRTWNPMTPTAGDMIGAEPQNHITTCAAHPNAPACTALPGALLVSSAAAGTADPAIELTAASAQVIQLALRAFVPSGGPQLIRLYRNSREDVLYTGMATAGTLLEQAVVLDALPGDRFLIALGAAGPAGGGVTDVAVHLFISATTATFPSTCQLALQFETRASNNTRDVCRNASFRLFRGPAQPVLTLEAGPFAELGTAAHLTAGSYLLDPDGKALDHARDLTVQLWVRPEVLDPLDAASAFSDVDLDVGGGIGVSIVAGRPPTLDVITCSDPRAPTFVHATAPFPEGNTWQFVRVVHTAAAIDVCLNGKRVATAQASTTQLPTIVFPALGKEALAAADNAHFDGALDDVRVFAGALPCAD